MKVFTFASPSRATCPAVLIGFVLPVTAAAQKGAQRGEWRSYGGDQGHTKYSPLDQIDASNVANLEIAWTWTSVDEQLREQNAIMREGPTFRTYAYRGDTAPGQWGALHDDQPRSGGDDRPNDR